MRRHLWLVLGLALVIGGVVLALVARPEPAEFGWFAYTPLSDAEGANLSGSGSWSRGSTFVVSRSQAIGYVALSLGLVVLAAGAGFALARRRSRRDTPS